MTTSNKVRRPSWLPIMRIPSGLSIELDSASFLCGRCTSGDDIIGFTALGPPNAITREAADHVLAQHADDQAAVAWAREQGAS